MGDHAFHQYCTPDLNAEAFCLKGRVYMVVGRIGDDAIHLVYNSDEEKRRSHPSVIFSLLLVLDPVFFFPPRGCLVVRTRELDFAQSDSVFGLISEPTISPAKYISVK